MHLLLICLCPSALFIQRSALRGTDSAGKLKQTALMLLCSTHSGNNTAAAVFFLKRGLPLHCGIKAAVGAVAFGCIRCLNGKEMFREEGRSEEWVEKDLVWMTARERTGTKGGDFEEYRRKNG